MSDRVVELEREIARLNGVVVASGRVVVEYQAKVDALQTEVRRLSRAEGELHDRALAAERDRRTAEAEVERLRAEVERLYAAMPHMRPVGSTPERDDTEQRFSLLEIDG